MYEGAYARGELGREAVQASASPERDLRARVKPTRLEQALDWAASLEPSPVRIATGCCGMSIARGGDPFEILGAGPPAVSARSADLLIVAGSITRRQAPLLEEIWARMIEPRWVIAWGACAISGGLYDNYATLPGIGARLPVDVVVPGCPPPPEALRPALELLRSGVTRGGARESGPSSNPADWPIQRADAGGRNRSPVDLKAGVSGRPAPEGDENGDHR